MAIAEMSLLTLVGLTSEKDGILNALQKTGAVEVKQTREYGLSRFETADQSEITAAIERAKKSVECVANAIDSCGKDYCGSEIIKDGFGVTLDEFFAMEKRKGEIESVISDIEEISAKKAETSRLSEKAKETLRSDKIWECVSEKFSQYHDTKYTRTRLGLIPQEKSVKFFEEIKNSDRVFCEVVGQSSAGTVVYLVVYSADIAEVEKLLSASSFVKCPYDGDFTISEKISGLESEIEKLNGEAQGFNDELTSFADDCKDIKTYIDYLAFLLEKKTAEEKMNCTASSFVMEAYVPTEAKDRVEEAIRNSSSATVTEYAPVPRNEYAPTLMKNNKVVKNFEAVTNMYSAPVYGAYDPNPVMSFFFSLFMGVIMADAVYGILMFVGGLLFAKTKREGTTVNRMAKVFAYGGIFAFVFGALFDSWFGFPLLRTLFPSEAYLSFYETQLDAIYSKTSLSGISIPKMLLWCLGFGTLQIAASLVCKAFQHFSRKEYVEGICGGFLWAIGLVGAVVAVFGICENVEVCSTYGLYLALGGIGIGVLTSGITKPGLKKVTSVFGSLYGMINYVSDILSYARLYGLMLSGAQIASIFTNTLAIGLLFPGGVIGVFFGVIVIIAGNVFNLAMSLLGAFIHDSRLQYVEFFGRFFEGDGELFAPLGSNRQYVYFVNHETK